MLNPQENVQFSRKFSIFAKMFNLQENFQFLQKFSICKKILNFQENFQFLQKYSICKKIFNFQENVVHGTWSRRLAEAKKTISAYSSVQGSYEMVFKKKALFLDFYYQDDIFWRFRETDLKKIDQTFHLASPRSPKGHYLLSLDLFDSVNLQTVKKKKRSVM